MFRSGRRQKRHKRAPFCGRFCRRRTLPHHWRERAGQSWLPRCTPAVFCAILLSVTAAFAQRPLTWPEVRERFEQANPTLDAATIAINEARAQEITAYLRPNPEFSL